MTDTPKLKTRKVLSGGTPSYQYGYYEMRTQKTTGKRRSYFQVLVNLDEHESPEEALAQWPKDIRRLREIGRESKADKLQDKLDRLQELSQ